MKFIMNAVTASLCSGGWMLLVTLCVPCMFGVKNCSEIGCLLSAELILKLKLP